jgi:hypothetical protein
VHGLIFFYIQKFAEAVSHGTTTWAVLRSTLKNSEAKYLPSGVYPDADAVQLLDSIAQSEGKPLPDVLERFGEFLAPNLVKVAGAYVEPSWTTLDLLEHTESIIHAMVRRTNPGAAPPVLETVRTAENELQLVYSSRRHLCRLAVGLIRGMARHYGEEISLEEPSCMLRGDPFCSFVIQTKKHDTHVERSPLSETVVFDSLGAGFSMAGPPHPEEAGRPDPLADADTLPASIGGYTVLKLIGRGGMGRVYLARDERLKRDVAIKMMHPAKARDPGARQRFLRESRSAAAVEHPHVMTIYQVGEERGLPFIVMKRLEGMTLGEYRESAGRLPLPEALRIGRETAEGLAAAHRRGLIHRDIKPDNIFLEAPDRSVRIIDFGLARDAAEDAGKLTLDGAVVGTPAYMSPERIGEKELDAKSDLFGLGVILYELLAGRLPFDGKSMISVLAAVARGNPTELRAVAPDVPQPVSDLVMRLLASDKADRPADAHAVAEELAALERAQK